MNDHKPSAATPQADTQTSSRYSLMNELMSRTDLSTAELRLCWFLLIQIMNNETGHCYCSDRHIAKQLSINTGTVYRAKRRLKQLGILEWSAPAACARAGTPSSFRFNWLRLQPRRQPNREHAGTPSAPTQAPAACADAGTKIRVQQPANGKPNNTYRNTPSDQSIYFGKIQIKDDTPQRQYWDAFLVKKTGKAAPHSTKGVWGFRTEWPEETTQ
jgi:hypothetical protein